MDTDTSGEGPRSRNHPEDFAADLVKHPVQPSKLCDLFNLLPCEAESFRSSSGKSFFTGLYSRVKTGLRANCTTFPQATRAFNAYVKACVPSHRWTSLALFEDVQTAFHVDALNSEWPNVVIPLDTFSGGSIWVQWPRDVPPDQSLTYEDKNIGDRVVSGCHLPVSEGPVSFCAKHLHHCTEQFSGRRLVMVAYSLQAFGHASDSDKSTLASLGFLLPSACDTPPSGTPMCLRATGDSASPVFVEVFAGSAGLTCTARQAGIKAIAVDWAGNKHEAKAASVNVDLSSSSGEATFFQMLEEKRPKAIHIAPPCGTASLARERPLPSSLLQQGVPQPMPLRSPEHVWGLPTLQGLDRIKVEAANKLYRFAARLMFWCLQAVCILSIENPLNSYFWSCLVDAVRELGSHACSLYNTLEHVVFSTCLHGGAREKYTKWLSTPGVFTSLAGNCPGESSSHRHLPYGVRKHNGRWSFDTAAEGAYPAVLCAKAIQCIAAALGFRSRPPAPRVSDPIGQTRRSRRLLPEFATVVVCPRNALPRKPHKVLGPSSGGVSRGPKPGTSAPSNPKLPLSDGLTPRPLSIAGHELSSPADSYQQEASAFMDQLEVGIYATPGEYLEKAKELRHPIDGELAVSDWTRRAIFEVLTKTPSELASHRAKVMKHVLQLRLKLEDVEVKLHDTMEPHIKRVMRGKRILLFQALLQEYGYDDLGVIDELVHGVPLTGLQAVPPYAEKDLKAAPSTREILESEAKWRNRAIFQKTTPQDDRVVLMEMGLKEVDLGFLSGPYASAAEVSKELGRTDWIANPRFVLYQGSKGKPRVIDDAKSSGLNDTYSSGERLRLQDIDYVATMCTLAGRLSAKQMVSVTLSSGETLAGKRAMSSPSWMGRTLDLRKAYKQMAVAECDRHLMVLTHEGPQGRLFYISDALPFGARGSVFSFLRTSRALSFLMNVCLVIPSSVFFDDFPSLTEAGSHASAFEGPRTLLKALGWLYADDQEKCRPFSSSFDVLGCTLDLRNLSAGSLIMSNRLGRLESIKDMVTKLRDGPDDRHMVQIVQGHLNFASGFIMGRALQPLARSLGWKQSREDFVSLCDGILSILGKCTPRHISWHSPAPPLILFTDASYEGGVAGIGAVLVDTLGGRPEVYDGQIPDDLVQHWTSTGQEQIISQAELTVVVAMRFMLGARLKGRRIIYFIDNEAARFALLKGTSGKDSMQRLAAAFHAADLIHPCVTWVERVPSSSNPSDSPSRGQADECVKAIGGVYVGKIGLPEEVHEAIKSSLLQSVSLSRQPVPIDSLALMPSLAA